MYPEIKKEFFAFRDGLTADVLRKGGLPHKMIFGLQIPQIRHIADTLSALSGEERRARALWLWSDRDVRESRLLACFLFDPSEISPEEALALASDLRSREEADMLAFRLLKRLPSPEAMLRSLEEAIEEEGPATVSRRMAAEALRRHLE